MSSSTRGAGVKLLQVEPTTRCNFICGFCCGRAMDQSDLSFQAFERMLACFPDLEHLELHGEGEPMLHPRIFDMARLARARGIRVTSITNGSHFTPRRIEAILDSGIAHLYISIESAIDAEFKEIRGGKLSKVCAGIRAMLAARDARGVRLPALGFGVTVLKRSMDALPSIVELYKSLGMDGGVSLHMLNTMPSYTSSYTRGMDAQLLGPLDQALVWARYARIARREAVAGGGVHFSDQIFGQMADGGPARRDRAKEYRSCSWLDHGLYVNRHGSSSGCARIKDTEKFGFGQVHHDEVDAIVARRDQMAGRVRAGEVPAACKGCFIADSIAVRMRGLLDRRLVRAGSPKPCAAEVIGDVPRDAPAEQALLAAFDGRRTVREIIDEMGTGPAIDPGESRRRLLPLVGELVRDGALVSAR
jgi:MoaA/NifB/PqqE/SkfB family radical SAM enzyme